MKHKLTIASENFGGAYAVYLNGKLVLDSMDHGNYGDITGEISSYWRDVLADISAKLNIEFIERSVYPPVVKLSSYFEPDEYDIEWPEDESVLKDEEVDYAETQNEESQNISGSINFKDGV